MSDLKLCWPLKIVLTFSAGLDIVTSGASLLELPTGQDHLCHCQGGGGNGDQPGVGKGMRRESSWGAPGGCKPSTYTFYCLSTAISETG